jgi:CO/xanthine dehydrogenase Mo-binding subunit
MYPCEAVVNELAEQLGMDPMDLRLKNASKQGTQRTNGGRFGAPIGNLEVMQAMKDHPHYRSELPCTRAARGWNA